MLHALPEEKQKIAEKEFLIDQEYKRRICQLSTDMLNDILIMNELGLFNRKPATVDAIHNELLERTLNENKQGNDC